MRIYISKLYESTASAPESPHAPTQGENFKELLAEFVPAESQPEMPAVEKSCDVVQPAVKEDTVESIKDHAANNMSWQVYYKSGGNFRLGEKFTVPKVLPSYDEAVRAIGPGGPYSVEAVTNCILSMAAHVAQGNPDKIAEIRQEIEKAVAIFRRDYKAATKEKDLPQICLDTYDAIMSGLDKLQAKYTDANEAAKMSA